MNNIHYCVRKGGVAGTKRGLFRGLLSSRGAGSPLPWNSEVKLRVCGRPRGVNKNRNTGMYRNTPSPLRGSKCIRYCSLCPIKILDNLNSIENSLIFVLLRIFVQVEYSKQNSCCAQPKLYCIKEDFKRMTERNCGADILKSMQDSSVTINYFLPNLYRIFI